jgi:hypothetical protein
MTTEEKLDKLTDRVDAIARNLELLSGMQIVTEEKLQRLEDTVNKAFTQVSNILQSHDERLDNLEGKQPQ